MKAVAAVAPLVWSNLVLPNLNLGIRGRTAANVGFASVFAAASSSRTLPWATVRGVRLGLVAAAVALAGYGVVLADPRLRRTVADRPVETRTDAEYLEWILVHIPLGTVYAEELIFRKTLDPMLGTPAAAVVFGLSHIAPARAAGDSVVATVAVTTLGGLIFGALARRGGSVIAPALAHLALNAGGAVVTRLGQGERRWL